MNEKMNLVWKKFHGIFFILNPIGKKVQIDYQTKTQVNLLFFKKDIQYIQHILQIKRTNSENVHSLLTHVILMFEFHTFYVKS